MSVQDVQKTEKPFQIFTKNASLILKVYNYTISKFVVAIWLMVLSMHFYYTCWAYFKPTLLSWTKTSAEKKHRFQPGLLDSLQEFENNGLTEVSKKGQDSQIEISQQLCNASRKRVCRQKNYAFFIPHTKPSACQGRWILSPSTIQSSD